MYDLSISMYDFGEGLQPKNTKRNYIGIEKDLQWYNIAKDRLK